MENEDLDVTQNEDNQLSHSNIPNLSNKEFQSSGFETQRKRHICTDVKQSSVGKLLAYLNQNKSDEMQNTFSNKELMF